MNDDDLKPPARRTVLPPPPMPSLDDAEEVEEAEDEEEEEDEEEDEESGFEFIMPTKKEESRMMKALVTMSSTHNEVLSNPVLADKLLTVTKRKFKDGDVTLSLKDPCANLRMITDGVVFLNSWVCSDNQHVTFDPNDMRPTMRT